MSTTCKQCGCIEHRSMFTNEIFVSGCNEHARTHSKEFRDAALTMLSKMPPLFISPPYVGSG